MSSRSFIGAGLTVAAAWSFTAVARGGTVQMLVTLDPDQENSGVVSDASGSGTVTLDTYTRSLGWTIAYEGLTGPLTAAHFHGPAPLCIPAGVQVAISSGGPPSGTLSGSATIGPAQAADLQAGLWYVNLHTAMHQGGEIRGQVVPGPLDDPIPGPILRSQVHVLLETVATGLVAPNWGTAAPGHPGRLLVTDQPGTVWAIELDTGNKTVFLDASALLTPLGIFGPGSFDERGLLGVAFHPDYGRNGLLYTYTSEPPSEAADFSTILPGGSANHQTVIREWQVPDPADPDSIVDPATTRVLLRVDQPQFNHNAGCMNFGPDGMLYIALGDGGGADDKDGQSFIGQPITGHGCTGNGADAGNPLGALLRIDPLGGNSANGRYGIPGDNPFVGRPGIVEEIFALGFRNPFRFSFDTATGDLYVGDVGQNDIEEIDVVVAGGDYGWNRKEGTFSFVANGNQPGYVTDVPLSAPPGLSDPIAQYDHDEGIAVIGGFVYRGERIPALRGRYVFGEFARTFANDGRLFHLDEAHAILELQLVGREALGLSLLGIGRDAAGELYALANATGVPFGDTGVVLRISVRIGDLDADGVVGMTDLKVLLGAWGGSGAADLNQDGLVGINDLLLLLANWG
jgi:glucose/arabinose dehydrogenase